MPNYLIRDFCRVYNHDYGDYVQVSSTTDDMLELDQCDSDGESYTLIKMPHEQAILVAKAILKVLGKDHEMPAKPPGVR